MNVKTEAAPQKATPTVGLLVTCLVDVFRPQVGFAAVRLLEDAGCRVAVPETQTCCGQPAFNSGARADAKAIAKQVVETFEGFDYVVGPSGSCISTLRCHYPELLADEAEWRQRAEAFAGRCHELMRFLTDVMGVERVTAQYAARATYHDSCSGLRELGIRHQPRNLLASVQGLALRELEDSDACCGFGGTFCVKYPEISERMVSDKVAGIQAVDAEVLLGGDLGCLLNIGGRLRRLGSPVRVFHAAEVLADMTDGPAIGEPEK
ncbi:MAG: (Fe-S)-binding protein [Gammaproteobacteria bacterium]|nr:MAG: (Fe-S)-binding protein [Gammaproteobacteria bacterium]